MKSLKELSGLLSSRAGRQQWTLSQLCTRPSNRCVSLLSDRRGGGRNELRAVVESRGEKAREAEGECWSSREGKPAMMAAGSKVISQSGTAVAHCQS